MRSVDELDDAIPDTLRFGRALDVPAGLTSEADLSRHVVRLLRDGRTTEDLVSFRRCCPTAGPPRTWCPSVAAARRQDHRGPGALPGRGHPPARGPDQVRRTLRAFAGAGATTVAVDAVDGPALSGSGTAVWRWAELVDD